MTGGSKFELLQEYREFKRGPGGVLVEEVEDAPVRGFEILALTPDTLMLKLAITSYTDEESGRRVTVPPEGDYFLVWSKAGKAAARSAPVVQEEDEEVWPVVPFDLAAPVRGRFMQHHVHPARCVLLRPIT